MATASTSITLYCYVLGDEPSLRFPVDIDTAATVGHLKRAIGAENIGALQHVNPNHLKLWAVSIPTDGNFSETLEVPHGSCELSSPDDLIKEVFPKVQRKHIHVVIERPIPHMLTLMYYILGSKPTSIFPVDIAQTKTVGHLKKAIIMDNVETLQHVSPSSLDLWVVSFPAGQALITSANDYSFDDEVPLPNEKLLSTVFRTFPAQGCVHIAIRTPSHLQLPLHESGDVLKELPEFKRYQEITDPKNEGKSPSEAAKSSEYTEIQRNSVNTIHDGLRAAARTVGTVAPPIGIFHSAFNQFVHDANNTRLQPSDESIIMAQEFTYLSSAIQTKEEQSNEEVLKQLGDFLGRDLVMERNEDGTKPDGMLMFETNREMRFPLLILERKRNLGEGGCDPSIQVGLRMRRTWVQPNRTAARNTTCCPTFLIATGGPWLCILGAVFTDKVIVQRLTGMIWVGHSSTHERGRVIQFARVMEALRTGVDSLYAFYTRHRSAIDNNAGLEFNPVLHHRRFYPYPTYFLDGDKKVYFDYKRALEDDSRCITYLAKLRDEDFRQIVVKFVDRYGVDVHRFLAARQFAPNLLYYGPLPAEDEEINHEGLAWAPRMMMVVMDYIKPATKPPPDDASVQIGGVLRLLHGEGYVFGDLRKPNALFDSGGSVKLIDFDWSGRYDMSKEDGGVPVDLQAIISNKAKTMTEGEGLGFVCYPAGLSPNIKWAPGAKALSEIRPGHDWAMLEKLWEGEE